VTALGYLVLAVLVLAGVTVVAVVGALVGCVLAVYYLGRSVLRLPVGTAVVILRPSSRRGKDTVGRPATRDGQAAGLPAVNTCASSLPVLSRPQTPTVATVTSSDATQATAATDPLTEVVEPSAGLDVLSTAALGDSDSPDTAEAMPGLLLQTGPEQGAGIEPAMQAVAPPENPVDEPDAEPDLIIVSASTGVVVGDHNTVTNVYCYHLIRPQFSLDVLTDDPKIEKALLDFLANPDDDVANRVFRNLLPADDLEVSSWQNAVLPVPGGPDSFSQWLLGDLVMVFRSKDIEIGEGVHHTNIFDCKIYSPTVDVSTVLRSDADLAHDLAVALVSFSAPCLADVCTDFGRAVEQLGIEPPDLPTTGFLDIEPGLIQVEGLLGGVVGDHNELTITTEALADRPVWLDLLSMEVLIENVDGWPYRPDNIDDPDGPEIGGPGILGFW